MVRRRGGERSDRRSSNHDVHYCYNKDTIGKALQPKSAYRIAKPRHAVYHAVHIPKGSITVTFRGSCLMRRFHSHQCLETIRQAPNRCLMLPAPKFCAVSLRSRLDGLLSAHLDVQPPTSSTASMVAFTLYPPNYQEHPTGLPKTLKEIERGE